MGVGPGLSMPPGCPILVDFGCDNEGGSGGTLSEGAEGEYDDGGSSVPPSDRELGQLDSGRMSLPRHVCDECGGRGSSGRGVHGPMERLTGRPGEW